MRVATLRAVIGGILVVGLLAACTSPTGGHLGATPDSPSQDHTTDPIAGMSLEQQVGQLFMVGTTASSAQAITLGLIAHRHLGNVFLSGRSRLGVAGTAAVVASLRSAVPRGSAGGIPLLVATDQEGGQVQVLQGPGFDAIPSGVQQGELGTAALLRDSTGWGAQLASAGVTMDLAPVVDLVGAPSTASGNPPIGAFQRELGFSASAVAEHADAFRSGLSASGIQTVLKHFPGLGFVSANTDTTANVTDTAVTATGASVAIYRHEIANGARNIMVSSATYEQLDPSEPAVFSHRIVTGLLRQRLGFSGLILTDDVSAAVQVEYLAPADRAIEAISAGVDVVLVTKDPTVAPQMMAAVVAKAKSDPAFAGLIANAARRVVEAKKAGNSAS